MEDTIAAVATAYGEGGIGIIRISGEKAIDILKEIFVPIRKGSLENRKLTYGFIVDPKTEEKIDEVLAVYMKSPNTYTKEDVAEINCHGSVVSLRRTLSLVLEQGARAAEPGEFTKRAFLNGRLDLSQAEAVIDLVKAKTDKGFSVSMNQLTGLMSQKIKDIRKELLDLLVQVTVNIDYPDEDIEEITYQNLIECISSINAMIEKLLSTSNTGRIIREGLNVAIIGKPNVGKSSLMNSLLKEARAIVTEIPGTTRDTIEEVVSIRDIPVKLIDTAGIRETQDIVERKGIEKSKESFNKADLIILILDSSRKLEAEDREIIEIIGGRRAIVLLNKTDLKKELSSAELQGLMPGAKFIETSIINEIGIDAVENEIENMVYEGDVSQKESMLVTNVRHKNLLQQASDAMCDAKGMAEQREALDFIEVDLSRAYQFLGEIIGETVTDDIINEVFSRFCLGK